jgi:cobalt-zinc-cadmium efflux system protein
MSHDHASAAGRGSTRRALTLALGITAAYTVAEIVGGLLADSLALLADAGHMLSDNVALGLALFAIWLAAKPPTPERTYGYKRAEILAALANGVALVAIALWIFVEAVRRLEQPPEVLGGLMLVVALIGLVVNTAAGLVLWRGRNESLNVGAAFRHVLADLLGSVGVIVAAIVILLTGWTQADAVISLVIGLLILVSAWTILRDSTRILLEATPRGINAAEVARVMAEHPSVTDVHDLHVWEVTSGFPALSAHVLVLPGADCHRIRRELERSLTERFAIDHTTLQVDHDRQRELLSIR